MADSTRDATWPPPTWQTDVYPHEDHAHNFYVAQSTTRPLASILLLHEFPGIDGRITAFADQLARSFRVVMPSIFGEDGDPHWKGSLRQICVRREVHALAREGVSKDVGWLKDFVDAHVSTDRSAYGVVGMCFSGSFALALAVDHRVKAAVVAQPAVPFWPPSALGLSSADRNALAGRGDLCARGYRFTQDWKSPDAKLEAVKGLLGERAEVVRLASSDRAKHSTLTGVTADEKARADVQSFLESALAPSAPPAGDG
ncbi:dienelactone hydrolase family protein [Microbacterium sp. SS28]|uniref:dienelactone hydrolase family protein n=1 Tax=Microbacterium sp. SS28 TaxID=2919948 RepID=UPI001FAA3AD2|nr:dienelactone hydrolase family protein [Microbacterium sp. SS28]